MDDTITYIDVEQMIIAISKHLLTYDGVVGMYLTEQITHITDACYGILTSGCASVNYDYIKIMVAKCVHDFYANQE